MLDLSQLKRARVRLGLTQTAFAKRAGLSQSLITKIEAGKIDPKYSTVQRIEEALSLLEKKEAPSVISAMQRHVISATLGERIPHIIKRMQQSGISQVPVLDGKHVAGLITERIILEVISAGKDTDHLTAQDIMSEAPPVIPVSSPLNVAAHLLEHSPILVVREKNAIAGIVTRADILKRSLR